MTMRTKLASSTVVLVVLAAAAIYWATVSSGATSTATAPGSSNSPVAQAVAAQQAPSAVVSSVEAAQLAQFSVLGTSGQAFPATFVPLVNGGAMKARYGLNVALAKPVGSSGDAWLIPGNGELCLWLTNAGGKSGGLTCATTASAIAGELAVSRMSEGPNAVQHVVGVVPDGTTAVAVSGSSQAVSIQDNGWAAVTGPDVSTATIATASGTKTVEVP